METQEEEHVKRSEGLQAVPALASIVMVFENCSSALSPWRLVTHLRRQGDNALIEAVWYCR